MDAIYHILKDHLKKLYEFSRADKQKYVYLCMYVMLMLWMRNEYT